MQLCNMLPCPLILLQHRRRYCCYPTRLTERAHRRLGMPRVVGNPVWYDHGTKDQVGVGCRLSKSNFIQLNIAELVARPR